MYTNRVWKIHATCCQLSVTIHCLPLFLHLWPRLSPLVTLCCYFLINYLPWLQLSKLLSKVVPHASCPMHLNVWILLTDYMTLLCIMISCLDLIFSQRDLLRDGCMRIMLPPFCLHLGIVYRERFSLPRYFLMFGTNKPGASSEFVGGGGGGIGGGGGGSTMAGSNVHDGKITISSFISLSHIISGGGHVFSRDGCLSMRNWYKKVSI